MPFSFDKFMTGLGAGLSTNRGPIGSFGQGFTSAYNAIKGMKDEEAERNAVSKIMSGDETGWQEWANVNPAGAMGAWNTQQKMKQLQSQKEFNTTNEIKNYEYRNSLDPEEQKIFDSFRKIQKEQLSPYEETMQKERAKAALKEEQTQKASVGRKQRISGLLSSVEQNKDLLTPYSPASSALGAITKGEWGMSDEEREIRGQLLREISAIKQELIARAKEQGQSGINTATEIEQATKGIDSGDYATLIGALKALNKYEDQVTGLENGMSIVPKKDEQVISFEDWMKQGS